ncbi:MAG TPA: hypothetical protein VMF31_03295 [Solirubrobacterales bacterium]|nr:hypothetical protein [Solirubrobacterales bacterium]
MPLPGNETTLIDELPPRSAANDTGVAFFAALTERGPVDRPVAVRSVRQLRRDFGAATNYSSLEAAATAFFAKGGSLFHLTRAVGPAAVKATGDLSDGSTGDALTVKAVDPGAWGNAITVAFTVSGGNITAVVKLDGKDVENSGPQVGKPGITAWSQTSRWVRITDGGGGSATSATVTLATGTDDRASITATQWKSALDLFERDLGPGQVAIPGVTAAAVHDEILLHASTHNRFGLLDADPSDTPATIIAAAEALTADGLGRHGAMIAPRVSDNGALLPGSPYVAGRLAHTDRVAGPGQYAAGSGYGDLEGVSLSVVYTDEERNALNEAGVQVIHDVKGAIRIYGFRTLAEPDSEYVEAAHARVIMALRADLEAAMEPFVLKRIDGRGKRLGELEGVLTGVCQRYFLSENLYGASPEQAYRVDAGSALNTPATLAAKELHAGVAVRVVPGAERVYLNLTKAPTAESLA